MIHKFEFPTSKGNSDGDIESNMFLNRMAVDSVNLSWNQSPHQLFAPIKVNSDFITPTNLFVNGMPNNNSSS